MREREEKQTREKGERETGERQQRKIGGRRQARCETRSSAHKPSYITKSHPLSCRSLPRFLRSPSPRDETQLLSATSTHTPCHPSASSPLLPPLPLAALCPSALPACLSSPYPMSESKGVLWGWIERAVRGLRCGRDRRTRPREERIREALYVSRCYIRTYVHVCRALCAYTHVCACIYMCVYVWRGERRWAILISLRGLSSISTFPLATVWNVARDHWPPTAYATPARERSELWLSAVIPTLPRLLPISTRPQFLSHLSFRSLWTHLASFASISYVLNKTYSKMVRK